MNPTTATLTINLTGTITIDTNTLQQEASIPSPTAKADLVYTVPEAANILKDTQTIVSTQL